MSKNEIGALFNLEGRIALVTGGAGLLGVQHAAAILACGGTPILLDIDPVGLGLAQSQLHDEFAKRVSCLKCDITLVDEVSSVRDRVLKQFGTIDVLINNAARNPKVDEKGSTAFSRVENFPMDQWDLDLSVGLGGAFICARVFGSYMAASGRGGVILNIASDLGVIAPDQRLYRKEHLEANMQPVKPVTYSVVKHGLLGLTKYLATYWCDQGVRCNSLSPGGVYTNQDEIFLRNLSGLIPLGRMARVDEYRGAIAFLCSGASSYMNGANLVIDGGRSVW